MRLSDLKLGREAMQTRPAVKQFRFPGSSTAKTSQSLDLKRNNRLSFLCYLMVPCETSVIYYKSLRADSPRKPGDTVTYWMDFSRTVHGLKKIPSLRWSRTLWYVVIGRNGSSRLGGRPSRFQIAGSPVLDLELRFCRPHLIH